VSGGDSPGPAYELAAGLETDWSAATLWWGDERCVPPDDERSNYLLVKKTLLERIDGQPKVQRIKGELGGAAATAEYDAKLEGVHLGLALQGIGPDGHTASLFPNAPALEERERRVVAAPHEDVERVTMTLPILSAANKVVYLDLGESKAEAARKAFAEEPSPETPASLLRSKDGETVVLLDRAAAAELDNSA
jgi:6-phosphogluconolactonase